MVKLWIPFGLSVVLLASTACGNHPSSNHPSSNHPSSQNHELNPVERSVLVRSDYYPHLQSVFRAESSQPPFSQSQLSQPRSYSAYDHPECLRSVANETWVLIHGQEPGSAVNIRPGPGFNHYDGHYTLVGDSAKVIGHRGNWYQTRFAETLHEGWLHCSVIDDPAL